MNTEEKELLDKFRSKIKDIPLDPYKSSDGYLLNWLIYAGHNVEKSETIFRKHIEWRKTNSMDTILTEEFNGLNDLLPYSIDGHDKDGRPVVILPLGKWNLSKAVANYSRQECFRYTMQYCERVEDACRQVYMESLTNPNVKPISQFTGIFDFKHFSIIEHMTPKNILLARDLAHASEANWPNIIHSIFVVNAKWVFRVFMNMLKGILTDSCMGRIICYGNDKNEWTNEILKTVDQSELIEEYGGTLGIVKK